MAQVTSFSASLISSLGGDTAVAAELANQAVIDMSDNANKMGTDMSSIQQTYQSLARGNYGMLDNLKLGYGGTKTEMQRLLDDATKLSGVQYDIGNFADITEAIHVVQTELGITGTTAKEAASTISGSVSTMKSAWSNWLAELGKDNGDLAGVTGELMSSVGTVLGNVVPRIKQILKGLVDSIPDLLSGLKSTLPASMQPFLNVVSSAITWFTNLNDTVKKALGWGAIFTVALGPILTIVGKVVSSAGSVVGVFGKVSGALGQVTNVFGTATGGISGLLKVFTKFLGPAALIATALIALWTQSDVFREAVTQLAGTVGAFIQTLVTSLKPVLTMVSSSLAPIVGQVGDLIGQVIAAAMPLIEWIAATLLPVFNTIVTTVSVVFAAIVPVIQSAMAVIRAIVQTATALISGDWSGAWQGMQNIVTAAWGLIASIVTSALSIVKSLISGALSIIKSVWSSVWGAVSSIFSSIWDGIRSAAASKISDVVATVSGVKNRITNLFAGAGSWLVSAGRNLLLGLASGISNAVGTVVAKENLQPARSSIP